MREAPHERAWCALLTATCHTPDIPALRRPTVQQPLVRTASACCQAAARARRKKSLRMPCAAGVACAPDCPTCTAVQRPTATTPCSVKDAGTGRRTLVLMPRAQRRLVSTPHVGGFDCTVLSGPRSIEQLVGRQPQRVPTCVPPPPRPRTWMRVQPDLAVQSRPLAPSGSARTRRLRLPPLVQDRNPHAALRAAPRIGREQPRASHPRHGAPTRSAPEFTTTGTPRRDSLASSVSPVAAVLDGRTTFEPTRYRSAPRIRRARPKPGPPERDADRHAAAHRRLRHFASRAQQRRGAARACAASSAPPGRT
jgi:hypothetical protein